MSATINIENELGFWDGKAIQFTTESSAYPVEHLHWPAMNLGEAVYTLISEHQRTGILVFVSGVREIDDAKADIGKHLIFQGISEDRFEIMGVHGNSQGEERRAASAMPKKDIKILIGTNILESGVSFPWVDGGVSSGKTKVMHVNGNVHNLVEEELPAWRIDQQEGRVRRFKPGVFILADDKARNARPDQALPDIVRLPLTELVMHCASFELNISELSFTAREQPNRESLEESTDLLVNYGLVSEEDGIIKLTEDGKMIKHLPLSFRASVAYCEAVRMNKLAMMLPLIAMLDIGDIRYDRRFPLIGQYWTTSDIVKQVLDAGYILRIQNEKGYPASRVWAEANNVNLKKIREFDLLLTDLEFKTRMMSDFSPYFKMEEWGASDEDRQVIDLLTKRVLFRANIQEMYRYQLIGVEVPTTGRYSGYSETASISKTTSTHIGFNREVIACSGSLRKITPKKGGFPFTVLEQVTVFTMSDFDHLIKEIGETTVRKWMSRMRYSNGLSKYFEMKAEAERNFETRSSKRNHEENFTDFSFDSKHDALTDQKSEGTLADILRSAGVR